MYRTPIRVQFKQKAIQAQEERTRRRYSVNFAIMAVLVVHFLVGQSADILPQEVDPGIGITTLRLWESDAPNSNGNNNEDIPTISVFLSQPGHETGTAVIVAPGGAYLGLASNLEGRQVADWFASHGIAAFLLKYRLGAKYPYPTPLIDAQRAIRWVRNHHKDYHVSPERIGMIGFSAGGHLAAMTATSSDFQGDPNDKDPIDRLSSKPDFLILGYPWLNAMEPAKPSFIPSYQKLIRIPDDKVNEFELKYTPKLFVTQNTPSTFIFSTSDDKVVSIDASVDFYNTLIEKGVSAEMHLFKTGAHGMGLGSYDAALEVWPSLLSQWMRGNGLLTPDPKIVAEIEAINSVPKRKTGEKLSLSSRVDDILADPEGKKVLEKWLGKESIDSLPETAMNLNLNTLLSFLPKKLSEKDIEKISTELGHGTPR